MAQNPTTDYAEIQQLESEALKAIYMDDFDIEEIRTGAWNKKSERKFRLKLWPQTEGRVPDIHALLSISLPTTYPKTLPHVILTYGDSVPPKIQKKIKSQIDEKARSLLGYESIHEIAVVVQDLLDEAVNVVAETARIPTLDKQRTQHEARTLQAAEAAKFARLQEQELASRKEDIARSILVEREIAIQARSRPTKIESTFLRPDDTALIDDSAHAAASFDQEMSVRIPGDGTLVSFKHICDIDFHLSGPLTKLYTARPFINGRRWSDSPPLLLMKTCELGKDWNDDAIKSEIASRLEPSLQSIQNLAAHRNVLPVLGFRIQSKFTEGSSRVWNVRILTEFVPKGSLFDVIEIAGRVEPVLFRTLLIQILEGLQHLHSHNISHGDISLRNILVERNKLGSFTTKLSDCFYQAELYRLKDSKTSRGTHRCLPRLWMPPEEGKVDMRPDPTEDMWYLGVVVLQLLFGCDVQNRFESPRSLMRDLNITASLEQMLLRMFHEKPAKRLSCFDLLASTFLRSDEPVLDTRPSPTLSRIPSNPNSLIQRFSRTRNVSLHAPASGTSRYMQDFSEHATLGKGGFGKVVRARNKLDGQWYAVKQIISESSYELQTVLSEVMLLSRLSHPNIVRYITAWLEEAFEHDSASAMHDDDVDDYSNDYMSVSNTQGDDLLSFQPTVSSNQGLDFIGSGAHIEFEGDSDEEPEESRENIIDDCGVTFESQGITGHADDLRYHSLDSKISRRPSMAVATRTKLYIQMEFCENQTLRDLIREDLPSRPDDYWRILRQITGALDHVHSQGIIHRDLKPENVFVTQGRSNVRLGDFGLAKPQIRHRQKGSSGAAIGPLTASIGTSVYIAPEVRSSGGGTYDEKADMYSLGIMLFEMCYSLKTTAMERARIIDELRRKDPVFPAGLESSGKLLEKELISGLISHEPRERASAASLIEQIPVDADDNALRRLIEGLSGDRNDPMHRKLVRQLFTNSVGDLDAQSYTYDLELAKEVSSLAQSHLYGLIKSKLTAIFHMHGAVERYEAQVLVPASGLYTESVKLMAMDGAILQLPYDLVLPRARMLAKQQDIQPCKSFAFSKVFRNNGAGHPRAFEVVDFDIISKSASHAARQEAEVLKVVDEIIDALPSLSSRSIRFLVNHSDVLNAILHSCNVPASKFVSTKAQLSRLGGGNSTAQIRSELRSPEIAIPLTAIDDIFRFDFREPLEDGLNRLRKLLIKTDDLEPAFLHLEKLLEYAKSFGVQHKISLHPLSCCNAEFYEGNLMFQCVLEKKNRAIICAGGRYDKLVRDHALTRSSQPCYATGFSLSLSGIIGSMDKYSRSPQRSILSRHGNFDNLAWSMRRCDVLIDSPDKATLGSIGVPILSELWANGIRAELNDYTGMSNSVGYGEHPEHELTLIVKADGSLRLRGQVRRDDLDLRRPELVSILRSELRERERLHHGKATEKPRLRHEQSELSSRDPEVSVLWSSSRSKKSNRQMIVDEAISRTAEDANQHLDIPIIAVELKDDVFDLLRETRLTDAESWKKVINHAEPGSRKYLSEMQNLLLEKSDCAKGLKSAYLYNFRSKACICYDLTQTI